MKHNKLQKTMAQSAPQTFMVLIPQENFSIEVDLMIAAHRKVIIQSNTVQSNASDFKNWTWSKNQFSIGC